MKKPTLALIGNTIDSIDVRLSYKIVELFSEGLYASPNKAIEELVANSFDAGAKKVLVLLSADLHGQDASIAVIDDGEGMNAAGLKQHWLIGVSGKRKGRSLPSGRQQIGKFGIGKLATYVLSNQLTHVSKRGGKYFATSMDYTDIDQRVGKEVEPKTPMRIPLRQPTEVEVMKLLKPWTGTDAFKASGMTLFGKGSPKSWTVTLMSSLKDKVYEIRPGHLEWVLRTAMPLRPDFEVWMNDKKLAPSKQGKGVLKEWVLGKDLTELPRPAKDIEVSEDKTVDKADPRRFGLLAPQLGRITGYVEAYKDLLSGKSDEIGRSYGFFVYVFDRLINVEDGHFGISPDELRHGTFGRFRAVVHMNGLDSLLRANREALMEGPALEEAKSILRAIFNSVRSTIESQPSLEEPGAQLARKLAASPGSLSRTPIVELARAVLENRGKARYLAVPDLKDEFEREAFMSELESRAAEPEKFVAGLTLDYNGSPDDGFAKYDTQTGNLRINAWHPLVATFHDEFSSKTSGQPLEVLAMAEVLAESHLHALGVPEITINDFLTTRDRLLRYLANESGHQSAFSVAASLKEARNNPDSLEEKVCAAFSSLGFETIPIGGKGKPDGVATAHLSASDDGQPRRYSVSLEAKSKEKDGARVANANVRVSAIARQRDDYSCNHAVIVGPSFSTTTGESSALAKEINTDREGTEAKGNRRTITLITVDDLARLVTLRPLKQLGLSELQGLFECRLPEESKKWIDSIEAKIVAKPPYKEIIGAIHKLQKDFNQANVKYSALRVELSYLSPPIKFDKDSELVELCNALAQMSSGAMHANTDTVELDQSKENVITAIEAAMREYNGQS